MSIIHIMIEVFCYFLSHSIAEIGNIIVNIRGHLVSQLNMNKSFNFILWVLIIIAALTTLTVSSSNENNMLRNAYAANDNWYVGCMYTS
jgi:hypothetical protein